jgi:hypothetical protein
MVTTRDLNVTGRKRVRVQEKQKHYLQIAGQMFPERTCNCAINCKKKEKREREREQTVTLMKVSAHESIVQEIVFYFNEHQNKLVARK